VKTRNLVQHYRQLIFGGSQCRVCFQRMTIVNTNFAVFLVFLKVSLSRPRPPSFHATFLLLVIIFQYYWTLCLSYQFKHIHWISRWTIINFKGVPVTFSQTCLRWKIESCKALSRNKRKYYFIFCWPCIM